MSGKSIYNHISTEGKFISHDKYLVSFPAARVGGRLNG